MPRFPSASGLNFLVSFFAIAMAVVSARAEARIEAVEDAHPVARLTGAEGSDSINPTWEVGVGGTDLGHMVNFKGRTYFLFGDTFSTELVTGEGWRRNALAYTTDTLFTDGIHFTGWAVDDAGRARAFIEDKRNDPIATIPTGGIDAGDRMYVWYMAVQGWGDRNDSCWRSHHSGLAWSEDGVTFHIQEDFIFPPDSNFGMVAAAKGDDDPNLADGYVYVWGTPPNRCGGVKLARVRPGDIANRAAWRFFGGVVGGRPLWIMNEGPARLIVPPRVGEMSMMYNRWAGVWTMMYLTYAEGLDVMRDSGSIHLRQAPHPWGPWSEPIEVIVPGEGTMHVYGSYMNTFYVENDGETVYFTLSKWDPYDVYLWKAKFRRAEGAGN